MSKIPFAVRKALLLLKFQRSYTASVCGHKTVLEGVVGTTDDEMILTMQPEDDGSPKYCLKCVDNMSIRCGWCGGSIQVGDPVTLYIPAQGHNVVGARYHENPNCIVGCLGWDCADTGGDMSGRWMPPGAVERQMSPIEACLATGKPVFGNMATGEVRVLDVDD